MKVPVKETESELPPTIGSDSQPSSSQSRFSLSNSQVRMPSLARISFQA